MYTIQKKPRSRRRYMLLLAVLVIVGAVFGLLQLQHASKEVPGKSSSAHSPQKSIPSPKSNTSNDISMLLTGDWIAHDSVNAAAKQTDGTYNYLPLVDVYAPLFKKTDINFCNDPILNGGAALGITGYPKFNSPTEFVTDMGKMGCNVINTASNHSFDFSQANIDASVAAWEKVPATLAVAGQNRTQAEHDQIHYFTKKDVKFAFLAYTAYSNSVPQNSFGVNVYNQQTAAAQIAQAKQNGAQIIIVSMRWGVEYSPTVNLQQEKAAQFLADSGANLVLGHGPHVLQPLQQLAGAGGNKTLVWYSLGNFVNTQEPAETVFNGVGLLNINRKTLAITPTGFLPFYMHYQWTPQQAKADETNARTGVKMYLLEDATQAQIDSHQLITSVAAQKQRISQTLQAKGVQIPLVTAKQLGF